MVLRLLLIVCLGVTLLCLTAAYADGIITRNACEPVTCEEGDVCLSFATVCNGKPCQQPVCIPARCGLPRREGRCRAKLRRYFFDASVLSCAVFNFGGCRGNRNRFFTRHACEKTCLLPPKSLG